MGHRGILFGGFIGIFLGFSIGITSQIFFDFSNNPDSNYLTGNIIQNTPQFAMFSSFNLILASILGFILAFVFSQIEDYYANKNFSIKDYISGL